MKKALAILLAAFMFIGIAAFWFLSVWLLGWVFRFLESLFSGAYVPLWLMPGWVQTVSQWLPFRAIRYTPLQIYLGNYTHIEALAAIGVQLLWICLLSLLQALLWRRGVRRIVVLGG